jgi:hypothetical protein
VKVQHGRWRRRAFVATSASNNSHFYIPDIELTRSGVEGSAVSFATLPTFQLFKGQDSTSGGSLKWGPVLFEGVISWQIRDGQRTCLRSHGQHGIRRVMTSLMSALPPLHNVYARLRAAGGTVIDQGQTRCCYANQRSLGLMIRLASHGRRL